MIGRKRPSTLCRVVQPTIRGICLLVYLYTGVANSTVGKYGSHFGKTVGILEEDNVAFIFNELQERQY
jgi:hypothetical protein